MKGFLLTAFFCIALLQMSRAQTYDKCGYKYAKAYMLAKNPAFKDQLPIPVTAAKLTHTTQAATIVTVPLIFHIVLDTATLRLIGDSVGVADRAITQINVLNEDYNRGNADSTMIPEVFKPYYGNPNIKFGLAHTDPNGKATNGWEIVTTNKNGFDVSDIDPCSDAKHASTGGADAWDVSSYINVWVINFLDNNAPTGVIGLTIPPSWTIDSTDGFPQSEMGVLLAADAFGRRSSPSEYFYPDIDLGRTLTHEMGHYFGLRHIWGDDGGLCPWNGGNDDGIADTPPQAGPTYLAPTYPVYDACSKMGSDGIMFMNYMDYTNDAQMDMFTIDQVAVMDATVVAGGVSFSVTTHAQLLQYPGDSIPQNDDFTIGPNPTTGATYINFNAVPSNLKNVTVLNTLGQKVIDMNVTGQQSTKYAVDFSGLSRGVYFVRMGFSNSVTVKKIVLQ